MSRLAREHPEDDRFQTADGQLDALTDEYPLDEAEVEKQREAEFFARRDDPILEFMQRGDAGPMRDIDDYASWLDEPPRADR